MCVRSSTAFYGGFNLDMDRSPGFGCTLTDCSPHRGHYAQLALGFPPATVFRTLTSPVKVTRRTVLQKVRGPPHKGVPQFVNTGFQVLFHSPPGVLFTFPSRYYALSVTKSYLALGGGPPCFPPDFSCPAVLWVQARSFVISTTGLLPSLAGLSIPLPL